MRFEIFALPILAALAEAAAIKSSSSSSSTACTTCPVTIKDTASAIASVMSQMSAQSPKPTAAVSTTTVTGSPVASTAVAQMTTAKSSSKTSSTKSTSKTSSTKSSSKTSSTKSSSKKLQRRTASSSTTTSASTTNVNSACATQSNYGYTYVPSPATPSAFLKDSTLHTQYMSASIPSGYTWSFAGYYASQLQSGYLFETELSSYNTTQCGSICDSLSTCHGFNIYFERDPTLYPADGCTNPTPQTNVRCAFYSQRVSEAYAVNIGQWRSSFAVVITGGNGYNKASMA